MRLAAGLLALALMAAPLAAPATALAAPRHHTSHRATVIRDPRAFVAGIYDGLHRGDFNPPEDIYTPRLAAAWAGMVHDARDEVGRVDFLFWIDGQDGDISTAVVTAVPVDQRPLNDRAIVVAKFKNGDRPEELHFYFERTAGAWKLDDVQAIRPEPWTLSLLLKYGWGDSN